MDSVGEGKGGMIWENGIETRIISYMKKKEMCNKQEPEEKEKKKKECQVKTWNKHMEKDM